MTAPRPGLAVALLVALTSCATGSPRLRRHGMPPPARESRVGAPRRSAGPAPGSLRPEVARAVEAASSLVGQRSIVIDGVDYGHDCAALVRAAFARAGRPFPPDVRDVSAVHALADRRGALSSTRRPRPGDIVFFADSPGGPPAHVGLVSRAEADGTCFVLHRVARGVLPVRVNLAYPGQPTDPATGKQINDTLVVNERGLPAGSLVVGVSDILHRG